MGEWGCKEKTEEKLEIVFLFDIADNVIMNKGFL